MNNVRIPDIAIEDTRFIYQRNFAGDPKKSGKFASTARKANIVINDIPTARQMMDAGFDVKLTKPREGEEEGFEPQYFISVEVKYTDKYGEPLRYLPKVYLVTDGVPEPTLLNEDTVGILDDIRVENVDIVIHPAAKEDGGYKAYVRTMYVKQNISDDPFINKYRTV